MVPYTPSKKGKLVYTGIRPKGNHSNKALPHNGSYYVKEDEQYPDSAHNFILYKDQYMIGYLYLNEGV